MLLRPVQPSTEGAKVSASQWKAATHLKTILHFYSMRVKIFSSWGGCDVKKKEASVNRRSPDYGHKVKYFKMHAAIKG